jgi:hypothetical protein
LMSSRLSEAHGALGSAAWLAKSSLGFARDDKGLLVLLMTDSKLRTW